MSVGLILLANFTLRAERLPIKTYTVADGLLRDNVFKIKQDSRGFMWFCTVEGISRFDGYAFENFTTADGLPDRHANDFLETRGGRLSICGARRNRRPNLQPVCDALVQNRRSRLAAFVVRRFGSASGGFGDLSFL